MLLLIAGLVFHIFQADFRQISGRFQADFRQVSGKFQAGFRQVSGKVQACFTQIQAGSIILQVYFIFHIIVIDFFLFPTDTLRSTVTEKKKKDTYQIKVNYPV